MSVDLIRYDLLVQDALRDVVRRVLTDVARDGLPGEHHFFIGFNTSAPGVRLSARLKERHPKTMTIVLQHQFWDLVVTDKFIEVGLSFGNVPERLHIPFDALTSFYDPSVKFGLQFEPPTAEEEEEAAAPTPAPAEDAPARPRTTSVPATSSAARPARLADSRPEPAATPLKSAPARPAPAAVRPADSKPVEAKPAERPKAGEPTAKSPAKEAPSKEAAKEPAGKEAAKEPPGKEPPAKDETGGSGAQVVRLDAFRKK